MSRLDEIKKRQQDFAPAYRLARPTEADAAEDMRWLIDELEKTMKPPIDELPQSHNLHMIYVGRAVFSIDGHPGLYSQTTSERDATPIKARKSAGKGNAAGSFYRLPELEARLKNAMGEK